MKAARRIDARHLTARAIELRLEPEQPLCPEQRKRELERRATDFAVYFYTEPEMQR